jgi:hypothetical protein
MSAPFRIPGAALAAAVLSAVGVLPLAGVAMLVVVLGGLEADDGHRDWWALLLVVPALVQLVATVVLVLRRGRWPLVLGAVLALAAAVLIVRTAASVDQAVGAGPFILVLFPVLAAGIAYSPPVSRWLAGRRRAA